MFGAESDERMCCACSGVADITSGALLFALFCVLERPYDGADE